MNHRPSATTEGGRPGEDRTAVLGGTQEDNSPEHRHRELRRRGWGAFLARLAFSWLFPYVFLATCFLASVLSLAAAWYPGKSQDVSAAPRDGLATRPLITEVSEELTSLPEQHAVEDPARSGNGSPESQQETTLAMAAQPGSQVDGAQLSEQQLRHLQQEVESKQRQLDDIDKQHKKLQEEYSQLSQNLNEANDQKGKLSGELVQKKRELAGLQQKQGQELLQKNTRLLDELHQLLAPSAQGQPRIVDALSKGVEEVLDRKFTNRLDLFKDKLDAQNASLNSMLDVLKQPAPEEDVALILYNSKTLPARTYAGAINNLVEELPSQQLYPKFRWGVYLAANGAIQERLVKLEESWVAGRQLPWPQEGEVNSSEQPDKLDVEKEIFAPAKTGNRRRRCVLVVSAGCSPPQEVPAQQQPLWWKNVEVDVLLIDFDWEMRWNGNDAKNHKDFLTKHVYWDWQCRRHQGVAFVFRPSLSIGAKKDQPFDQPALDALKRRLLPLMRPRDPGAS